MDTDSTLHEMSQYDFSKPINVTISLDDSDVESEPLDIVRPNVQKEYDEQTTYSSNPIECLSKSHGLPNNPVIDLNTTSSNEMSETNTTPYVDQNNHPDILTQVIAKNMEKLRNPNSHQRALKQYEQNSTSSNRNGNFPSNYSDNNKSQNVHNRMTNYIRELLNAVSENLLAILQAYRGFTLIKANPKSTYAEIGNSWQHFITTKYHFFKLSYSTVMTLFLPEHKIGDFDEPFLADTLKLSRNKGMYFTYGELKRLYLEMIHWLVTNKEKLSEVHLRKMMDYNKQQEQRNLPSTNINSRSAQKRPPPPYKEPISKIKLRKIFSSGAPGREVQINVNESYLPSYPNAFNTTAPTNIAQSKQNMYVFTQEDYANTINNYNSQSTHSNELNSYISIQNSNLIQNYNNTTYSEIPHLPSIDYISQTVPDNYNIQITDVRSERPTLPEENRRKSITDQTNVRSSDSRDSGIISPLDFNSTNEQTYNTNSEDRYYWQFQLPSLPDITSLNPNGSLVNTSVCHTCAKDTNTKCKSCYKTYYCSQLCQTLDWSNHNNVCVRSEQLQSTFS